MQSIVENNAALASRKTCKCVFCGREFKASRTSQYCSKQCRIKAWTAKRSRKRALRNGKKERICPICGHTFAVDPEHQNQKFCSQVCKKRADMESRSRNRLRKDSISLGKISENLPSSLDALREKKGKEYFKVLFSLKREEQYAEMAKWTEEDHQKALSYCGLQSIIIEAEEEAEEAMDEELLRIKDEPKPVFDEEDHFGDM